MRWPVERQRLRPARRSSAVERSRFLSPRWTEERARECLWHKGRSRHPRALCSQSSMAAFMASSCSRTIGLSNSRLLVFASFSVMGRTRRWFRRLSRVLFTVPSMRHAHGGHGAHVTRVMRVRGAGCVWGRGARGATTSSSNWLPSESSERRRRNSAKGFNPRRGAGSWEGRGRLMMVSPSTPASACCFHAGVRHDVQREGATYQR